VAAYIFLYAERTKEGWTYMLDKLDLEVNANHESKSGIDGH
jgi:hypothetical protein